MLFSSPVFLFMFLPLLLVAYFCAKKSLQNMILLAFSLIFYAWGEPFYLIVMIFCILINYYSALLLDFVPKHRKSVLVVCILINIGLLFYFKYANFFIENLNLLLASLGTALLPKIHVVMPIGISFFTFQSLSYVIDVYRGQVPAQKKVVNVALYVSLFPQLIAGPIVRYIDIAAEVDHRQTTFSSFADGIRRFIIGLGKKVIIANTMAATADSIFSLSTNTISPVVSWIGIICYTLQIYYDFSGYSDMAIGLGKLFGFTFLENFEYPYISKSITEFWRRWHISLSTWFRDYVYIPLGGNRKGKMRTYFNSFVVFFVTGFWHGASWNFIVWGLFHGCFLVLEKAKILDSSRLPVKNDSAGVKVISHLFTMLIVIIGWVFFRSDTLSYAVSYLSRMFCLTSAEVILYTPAYYLNKQLLFILFFAIVLSTPIFPAFERKYKNNVSIMLAKDCVLIAVFLIAFMALASSVYNPFIYFRF